MAPKLNLIVAASENLGIGLNGELPWKLKAELQHFSRLTKRTKDPSKKNVVIMGRKTWESIPEKFRPLPGRVNIVLSSTLTASDAPGAIIQPSLSSTVKALQEQPLSEEYETAWVIGGTSVYSSALASEYFHRLYLTKIHKDCKCDTFLPPIDEENLILIDDPDVPKGVQEENGITYEYRVLEKMS